jgi:hypothetical protein
MRTVLSQKHGQIKNIEHATIEDIWLALRVYLLLLLQQNESVLFLYKRVSCR